MLRHHIRHFIIVVFTFFHGFLQAQQAHVLNPGLLTKEWGASWITTGTPNNNYDVCYFRCTFVVATKPQNYTVHISANSRYIFYVNGKRIGRGPARSDKFNWQYDSYNIAPYLTGGRNLIAMQVWQLSNFSPVAQTNIGNTAALLVQGNSNVEKECNTGYGNWTVLNDNAYKPYPVAANQTRGEYYAMGACDSVNASAYPWGWEQLSYTENGWQQPIKLATGKPKGFAFGYGDAPAYLVPRSIPFMEEKMQRCFTIVRQTGINKTEIFNDSLSGTIIPAHTKVSFLLDQKNLTTAYPILKVTGGKGSAINIGYAESLFDKDLKKGNRNEIEGKKLLGCHDAFLPDGGSNREFTTLWYRTWRYVQFEISTGDEQLTINDFYGLFTAYPFELKASFVAGNKLLTDIWNTGWRTARLCANETYYDCPYYEQLQYIGDTRIQSLISLYMTGDDRLMRNAIEQFDYSRLPEGLTQSRYPSALPQVIPPFSLYWVDMVHDYYRYRNDSLFIKKFLPGIEQVLGWFEQKLNNKKLLGNLTWWNFVDWADGYNPNRGVPTGAEGNEGSAIVSLQYVYALQRAAELFNYFDMKAKGDCYQNLAGLINKSVTKYCYNEDKKLFADSPEKQQYSQHTNAMAILTNAAPKVLQAALVQKIMKDTGLVQCTIYYQFYLLQALKKAGLANDYMAHLKPWEKMLEQGLTTFAETDKNPRSDCHAWSASPLVELLATICGIEPNSPGFKTVRIEPHLGTLPKVYGSIPHPLGVINVEFQRNENVGLNAQVTLPKGLTGIFIWNNKTTKLHSGFQQIKL